LKVHISRKNQRVFISVLILNFISLTAFIYATDFESEAFTKQPDYEQLLDSAIKEKNKEIRMEQETVGDNFFIETKEMGDYENYEDSGDVFKEIRLSAIDSHVEPHVLGTDETAIYSGERGKPWNLLKGDKLKFHVYVDTEYYQGIGQIYFGALKNGEPFLTDKLKEGAEVETEKEFEFIVPETGKYQFYLFRDSKEPIIIKWIEISIS
jgi:hypothetical protein